MKKRWLFAACSLLMAFTVGAAVACGGDEGEGGGNETPFTPKPVDGIPLAFDDGTSYFSVDPSAIVEDGKMYLFYTTNPDAGVKEGSSVALRIGTQENGAWTFGERSVVLTPTEGTWDAGSVSNADVVKGKFALGGKEYAYLMVYQGCSGLSELNHNIGAAVADSPEGPWVKLPEPVIRYDSSKDGAFWGVGQPSLVSYDHEGKVYLFYTKGEQLKTGQMVAEMDFSDCSAVTGANSAYALPVRGLQDAVTTEVVFSNAGFASLGDEFLCSRDVNPTATMAPKVANAVQVSRIAADDFYTLSGEWEIVEERINLLDLATDDTNGWQRVYSSSVLKDAYGEAYGEGSVTVLATVTSFDVKTREYIWYQGIILYELEI